MFKSARLKLTAWYLLIIMVISVCFSVVIYKFLVNEIDRISYIQRIRVQRRGDFGFYDQRMIDPEVIEETKRRVLVTLGLIDGAIFVISGATGYFLAGRTLLPISQMLEEQNRFVSDASHEFRTPLTSLKIAMEVYLRGKKHSTSETSELIAENINEVNKLQLLSDSLLKLSQYEKDEKLFFKKKSLDEILKYAVSKVEAIAKKKKIKIINKKSNLIVKSVNDSLEQLFVILLDNAVKYSEENSKVIVKTKKNDGHIIVDVVDYGIGIDKKDLPHIFDRFYRADSARSRKGVGGYGLGLSIAKKIAFEHNGTINAKSEIGKGSTFSVVLQKV